MVCGLSCSVAHRILVLPCCCSVPRHVWIFLTPWTAAPQALLSLTIFQSLLKFISMASMMPSIHLILWCPLFLLLSIFHSIRDISNESPVYISWPKYWRFSFSISPSNEYSGVISLKIDWFDVFAVQGSFRSLLQHHSSKASILWCSAFFMVQLSQSNVTIGKTIALTISSTRDETHIPWIARWILNH